MKVSVVVPLFNKRRYVLRCLDSIARQTFADWEAIIVDDGSTDGGESVAAQYPDSRFRLIRQPNRGPGAARNRGVTEARGTFLAFLDADDYWLPEYLQTSLELFEHAGPGLSVVTCGYADDPGCVSRELMWKRRGITGGLQRVWPGMPALQLLYMLAYMSPCSTVARAETVRKWGGFFERDGCRFAEDATLWIKVLLNEPVCFDLRPLVVFDRAASSLSDRLKSSRPVEPFLLDPAEVLKDCPEPLTELLTRFLALRAYKTAAVLGSWGQGRQAREVFRRFVRWSDWSSVYFWCALAGASPAGGLIGRCWRAAAALSRSPVPDPTGE